MYARETKIVWHLVDVVFILFIVMVVVAVMVLY